LQPGQASHITPEFDTLSPYLKVLVESLDAAEDAGEVTAVAKLRG
jgi:hypothetical protein